MPRSMEFALHKTQLDVKLVDDLTPYNVLVLLVGEPPKEFNVIKFIADRFN